MIVKKFNDLLESIILLDGEEYETNNTKLIETFEPTTYDTKYSVFNSDVCYC